MPWARIDDMLPVHPKIRALSDAAFRLYISAICWSNLNQTDGCIPAQQIHFVSDVRSPRKHAEQLVAAGLWEEADCGWKIHDYLEYQPSAEKVKREREAKRERQARWRSSVDASTAPSQDASQDASLAYARAYARPHPIPSPNGSVVDQPTDRTRHSADLILIKATKQAITDRLGRTITDDQALLIAKQIIGSETVHNPAAYVSAAIRRDAAPRRFLPIELPPPPPVSQEPDPPNAEYLAARAATQGRDS